MPECPPAQNRPLFATRRQILLKVASVLVLGACSASVPSAKRKSDTGTPPDNDWRSLSTADWRQRLDPLAFRVLRQNGTEPPFSSPLNHENRTGLYHCAGCDLALFSSKTRYDSGTGWPSFWDVLNGAVATRPDRTLWMVRTEYHCVRCGGHQGHVFTDGPEPTGLRYCNNGAALAFHPAAGTQEHQPG